MSFSQVFTFSLISISYLSLAFLDRDKIAMFRLKGASPLKYK